MSRILTLLLLFCALTDFAQTPLLTTQWNQEYPYNMLCPADPMNYYNHCYAGCPSVAMGQIINHLRTTQERPDTMSCLSANSQIENPFRYLFRMVHQQLSMIHFGKDFDMSVWMNFA